MAPRYTSARVIILTLAFGRVELRLSLGNNQTETFSPYMVRPLNGFILTICGSLISLHIGGKHFLQCYINVYYFESGLEFSYVPLENKQI